MDKYIGLYLQDVGCYGRWDKYTFTTLYSRHNSRLIIKHILAHLRPTLKRILYLAFAGNCIRPFVDFLLKTLSFDVR